MPSAAGAGLPPVSVLFQGKEKSLGILSKYMEIHGTVYYESQRPPEVPAFVKNHGLLPQPEFQQLLRKAKVSPPPRALPLPARHRRHAGARLPVLPGVITHDAFRVWTGPGLPRCPEPQAQAFWRLARAEGRNGVRSKQGGPTAKGSVTGEEMGRPPAPAQWTPVRPSFPSQ